MRAVLLLLAACFLAAGCAVVMRLPGMPYQEGVADPLVQAAEAHVPVAALGRGARAAWAAGELGPLWDVRLWYPWLLAPLWLLALVVGHPSHPRLRQLAGGLLVLATCGVVAVEGAYLACDYEPFLPEPWGDAEGVVVFAAVLFVLLARRPVDRRLDGVEGHVGAHAWLAFLHLATLPSTFARRWWQAGADGGTILARLLDGFPPPFLAALACSLALGLVVLLRRAEVPRGLPQGA